MCHISQCQSSAVILLSISFIQQSSVILTSIKLGFTHKYKPSDIIFI